MFFITRGITSHRDILPAEEHYSTNALDHSLDRFWADCRPFSGSGLDWSGGRGRYVDGAALPKTSRLGQGSTGFSCPTHASHVL